MKTASQKPSNEHKTQKDFNDQSFQQWDNDAC